MAAYASPAEFAKNEIASNDVSEMYLYDIYHALENILTTKLFVL